MKKSIKYEKKLFSGVQRQKSACQEDPRSYGKRRDARDAELEWLNW